MDGLFNSVASFFENTFKGLGEPARYYGLFWRNYSDFNGRASKAEFWYPFLFNLVIGVILSVITGILGAAKLAIVGSVISGIWGLICIVPNISVAVRRLHDVNKSGLWLLLCLICCFIVPLIFCIMDPINDGNKYGAPSSNSGSGSTNYNPQPQMQSQQIYQEPVQPVQPQAPVDMGSLSAEANSQPSIESQADAQGTDSFEI